MPSPVAQTKLMQITTQHRVDPEDVVLLSTDTDDVLEAVYGQQKGRPRRVLIDPAGVVIVHERI